MSAQNRDAGDPAGERLVQVPVDEAADPQRGEHEPDEAVAAEQAVRVLSPSVSGLTPVLYYGDKFYISCCGDIRFPEGLALVKSYGKVYLENDDSLVAPPYDQPITLGLEANGQVVPSRYFRFYGSQHASGDGQPRLLELPASPDDEPIQYLYVWAKMQSNVWAQPKKIALSLIQAAQTASSDTEP